jgi:hypothetical protein
MQQQSKGSEKALSKKDALRRHRRHKKLMRRELKHDHSPRVSKALADGPAAVGEQDKDGGGEEKKEEEEERRKLTFENQMKQDGEGGDLKKDENTNDEMEIQAAFANKMIHHPTEDVVMDEFLNDDDGGDMGEDDDDDDGSDDDNDDDNDDDEFGGPEDELAAFVESSVDGHWPVLVDCVKALVAWRTLAAAHELKSVESLQAAASEAQGCTGVKVSAVQEARELASKMEKGMDSLADGRRAWGMVLDASEELVGDLLFVQRNAQGFNAHQSERLPNMGKELSLQKEKLDEKHRQALEPLVGEMTELAEEALENADTLEGFTFEEGKRLARKTALAKRYQGLVAASELLQETVDAKQASAATRRFEAFAEVGSALGQAEDDAEAAVRDMERAAKQLEDAQAEVERAQADEEIGEAQVCVSRVCV